MNIYPRNVIIAAAMIILFALTCMTANAQVSSVGGVPIERQGTGKVFKGAVGGARFVMELMRSGDDLSGSY